MRVQCVLDSMLNRAFFCALVLSLTASTLLAAPHSSQSTPKPEPLQVPLLAEGLKLSDFDGMAPRAELKDKLLRVTDFVQQQPSDGKPATQATEAYLGYTRTTLYVVFVCHDDHPEQIRSHLARRENIQSDDNVSVLLDPFEDHRKGVMFQVNPNGVQGDAAWSENNQMDYSYDQVWDSEARITKQGYVALLAIPFRSLRFRPEGKSWGVVMNRSIPRNSESDFWPRVAANVSGVLSQEATLSGIHGVTGSHNVQLNPYVLGQNERELNNLDATNPFFSARRLEGTAGGELKFILKDSIVVDATVNPDFSNIESDQPQFTVNQRYPVFFPELRPFFLENASYFGTPTNLLYTRNIVHPEFGVRATGKVGKTNIGLLAIDDREPGETVAPGDALFHERALNTVGRVSQDIGKGSSVGVMYTDAEFGQGWNRIGAVDFVARMNDKWTGQGQWSQSATMGTKDSGTPPSYAAGPALELMLQRNGHAFNMFNDYMDVSKGFQTQLGFLQTSNIRSEHTHINYQWFPKSKTLQSWGLEWNDNIAYDHDGNRVYRYLTADPFFLLSRNTVLAPLVGMSNDTLGPQNGYGFTANRNFEENFVGLVVRSAPLSQLNFNVVASDGSNVNYNPVAGRLPTEMRQQFVQANVTLQPIQQLTADNTYLLDREHSAKDGGLVYESQKLRTKINYQFTRAISARVIVEYDSTLVNPAETTLQRTKQIGTEALLTWLPHPGTAVYIGYNNDLQNLSRALCNRLPGGGCDPNDTTPPVGPNYLNDGRQIFVKASYLFRF